MPSCLPVRAISAFQPAKISSSSAPARLLANTTNARPARTINARSQASNKNQHVGSNDGKVEKGHIEKARASRHRTQSSLCHSPTSRTNCSNRKMGRSKRNGFVVRYTNLRLSDRRLTCVWFEQIAMRRLATRAYCGAARTAPIYPTERSATCRTRIAANNPLILACVKSTAP